MLQMRVEIHNQDLLLIGRTCHVGLQIHGEIHKQTVLTIYM